MRILLLTDNYLPEAAAPAVRCRAHAKRWAERGHLVKVVTSFPNYPDGKILNDYRQSLFMREKIDMVDILRVPTLVFPNRGFFLRILDYLSFMLTGTIASLFVSRPDVVIATSPHFFTALAGWFVSRFHRRPFVFEIRDLWPDSIVAVGAMKEGFVIKLIRRLEHFLYRQADLIVTVTFSTRDVLIARKIDASKIVVVTNGIVPEDFTPGGVPSSLRDGLGLQDKVVVSYIGTVGMAHGLQLILDAAAVCQERVPEVQFVIVGSGAERGDLERQAQFRRLANVTFVGRVAHSDIVDYWRLSDITLVLLRDTPLFRTVIPSKIFEAMATSTPIITNVRGEVRSILEPLEAAEMIEPDDVKALVSAIERLARSPVLRHSMAQAGLEGVKQYDRIALADRMLSALESVGRSTRNP